MSLLSGAYTGVGAQLTPVPVGRVMAQLARQLAILGLTLRSGGADGADTFFEIGCDERRGAKEIYLPWPYPDCRGPEFISEHPPAATAIFRGLHPHWKTWPRSSRLLHTRNIPQLLGRDVASPSRFVLTWTQDGALRGGTRTVLMLAEQHGVPVYNLGHPDLRGVTAPQILDLLHGQGYLDELNRVQRATSTSLWQTCDV